MNQPLRTRRQFIKTLGASAAMIAAGHRYLSAKDTVATNRPNIIFILADDMGYGDVNAYNPQSKIPTPNLDRLINSGVRFTDAHAAGSLCVPSRYGLITGEYMWRNKSIKKSGSGYSGSLISSEQTTVASLLKKQGYHTGCVGKWHLGLGPANQKTDFDNPISPSPNQIGFDYFFGLPASLDIPPYVYIENNRATEPLDVDVSASETPGARWAAGKFWRAGKTTKTFKHDKVLQKFTSTGVKFIKDAAGESEPFFLYLPFTAPHTPWLPARKYRGKSAAGEYGDFAAQVDGCVGQIIDAVNKLKISKNTLIFFGSDNGAFWIKDEIKQYNHRANGPLRGQKGDIWEGGHRMPFAASWPGKIPAGKTSDQLICFTDLLATLADLTGVKLPAAAGADSFSFLPALFGDNEKGKLRSSIIHKTSQFAVRQGDWKLITFLGSGGFTKPRVIKPQKNGPTGQLYNLMIDPGETKNLYLTNPVKVKELTRLLEKQQQQGCSRPGFSS